MNDYDLIAESIEILGAKSDQLSVSIFEKMINLSPSARSAITSSSMTEDYSIQLEYMLTKAIELIMEFSEESPDRFISLQHHINFHENRGISLDHYIVYFDCIIQEMTIMLGDNFGVESRKAWQRQTSSIISYLSKSI